jgi:LysM repeat protein
LRTPIAQVIALEKKMATKRIIVFIVFALFSLILSACELSASTPPPAESTDEGSMATLEAVLGGIATQTFVAGGSAATQAPQETVVPQGTPPAEEAPAGEAEEPQPSEPPAEEEGEPEQEAEEEQAIEVPTPTPGLPSSYTLQKGEFPFCIARRFDVNQYELLDINGLGLNSKPQVGFNLRIPQTGNPFSGDRSLQDHPTTYTVAAGDTIYSIACKFGDVDPMSIAIANDLDAPYNLEAGDRIHIPEY